jgi:hypothetical protein
MEYQGVGLHISLLQLVMMQASTVPDGGAAIDHMHRNA